MRNPGARVWYLGDGITSFDLWKQAGCGAVHFGLSFKWLGLSMTGDPKGQAESRRPKLFGLKAESEVPVYLDLHKCPKPWPNMQEWIVSDSISSTGSIVLGILQVQVDGRKVTSRRITAPIDY